MMISRNHLDTNKKSLEKSAPGTKIWNKQFH